MAVEALRQLCSTAIYSPAKVSVENVKSNDLTDVSDSKSQLNHIINSKQEHLICQICSETFERKIDLNNHLVCHAVDRPHSCRICGTLFIHKKELIKHLSTHMKAVDPHRCKTCGLTFTRHSSLTNHTKIHNYQPGRALMPKFETVNFVEVNNSKFIIDSMEPDEENSVESDEPEKAIILPSIGHIGSLPSWDLTYGDNFQTDVNLEIGQEMTIGSLEDEKVCTDSLTYENSNQQDGIVNVLNKQEHDLDGTTVSKTYSCNHCKKKFSREKALLCHEKIHNNQCEYCDRCFTNEGTLHHHMNQCRERDIYMTQSNAEDRSKDDSDDYKPKDTKANIAFAIKNGKLKPKGFKHGCTLCEKRFTSKQKLFRHMWIHRKKTFVCETCGKSFEEKENLDMHRLTLHQGASAFTCNECGKSFSSRQGLWEHNRVHKTATNSYECTICQKTFSSRQGYLIHKRTHNDERPYGCRYCWKCFRDGGTLRKHERIHTGERPHVCPLCPKNFNQKVVLREHIRWLHAFNSVPNEKGSFGCPLCNCTLLDKDELCAHVLKHSDQLALLAKKASAQNVKQEKNLTTLPSNLHSSIMQAVKTETEIVPSMDNSVYSDNSNLVLQTQCLECDICNATFNDREELIQHVQVHI